MFYRTRRDLLFLFTLIGFLLLGLYYRVQLLFSRGENYEMDQAVILYWGRRLWKEGRWEIFGPEFTHWELLMSYLAGGVDLLGVNPQWVPFVLSMAEVVALGFLVSRTLSPLAGLAASALLMLSPYHLFYSSIVGTCVGVGIWVLLYLARPSSRVFGSALLLLGLLHYSALRVFLFAEVLAQIWRRNWRGVLLPFASFFLFLALVVTLQAELWASAFVRGGYVFELPGYSLMNSFLRGLVYWWTPSLENWSEGLRAASAMEVSEAYRRVAMAWDAPAGWLVGLGILFLIWSRRRELIGLGEASPEIHLLRMFLISSLVLAPVASFTHHLWLLPVAVGLGVMGLWPVKRELGRVLVFLALGVSAWQSHALVQQFQEPFPGDFFSARIPYYVRELQSSQDVEEVSRFLIAPQGLYEARYWAERTKGFQILAVDRADEMEQRLRLVNSPEGVQLLLIDRFRDTDPLLVHFPGIAETHARSELFIRHLKKYAQALEESVVKTPYSEALLLKVRWP